MATALEKKRAFKAHYKGDVSICTCGHQGDHSLDGEEVFSGHAGLAGHGYCHHRWCECSKFTWAAFLPFYEAKLASFKDDEP